MCIPMQKTRQQILDILNHLGKATVQEIVEELQKVRQDNITAVTVRHHLNMLQKENLIVCPQIRHKSKPGRPQHVYKLTEKAREHLPTNYPQLTLGVIQEIRKQLSSNGVNVILEGVADNMAMAANIPPMPLEQRLSAVIQYLNELGYEAHWESADSGYLLHTSNCPYHSISVYDNSLCHMDMRLITQLVGVVPRRHSRISDGETSCSYFFPMG